MLEMTDFTDFAEILRFHLLLLLYKYYSIVYLQFEREELNYIKSQNFREIRNFRHY